MLLRAVAMVTMATDFSYMNPRDPLSPLKFSELIVYSSSVRLKDCTGVKYTYYIVNFKVHYKIVMCLI